MLAGWIVFTIALIELPARSLFKVLLASLSIIQASSLPIMTASLYLLLVAWRAEGEG